MYERFYHLRERPFSLSPDPDYLYPSRVHTEALSHLRYGIEGHAGFVVITGEIGSGKTTLLQTAMRGLDTRTSVARLVNTSLDSRELIEAVMLDFGLDPQPGQSKPHLLRDLARFLVNQRTAGRLPLLIIDEAQNLSPAALEEVRMLSNLETEKSKLIQIILVGQPNLHDVLNGPQFEQLRQRVTVRYHLRSLDRDETAAYVNHRLRKAAIGAPLVFSREVTDVIGECSQGLPRKINVIADAVLLFGYGEDKHVIDAAFVRGVIDELRATGVLAPAAAAATPAAPQAPPPAVATPAARQASPAAPVVKPPSPPPDPPRPAPPSADAIASAQRALAAREAAVAARERELAERHRVLNEQYRLLSKQQNLSVARPTVPPRTPKPATPPAAACGSVLFAPRAPSFWARLCRSLFGVGRPVLSE